MKILRPQGRRKGEMFAGFSGTEKLHYLHLWSIGADGHEYAVKDNEQTETSMGAGFELYSDARARGATPPALAPGAVAAMEYETQVRPYENDIVWVPEEDIPVVKERLQLNLPPGFTYTSAWKGKQSATPIDLEKGRSLWEASSLPALKLEDVELAPSWFSLASRLDVFYAGPASNQYPALHGSWKDMGEWYEVLARDRNKPDAAIAAKAQELVAGKTDFRDRVEAVSNFVQQQIRYVAIEVGIGGYQPHPAADTFRARYGDCKDKATLLSAMLQAVGVHSTWVMVDTRRGVVAKNAPSVVGNHMIAAIELPVGYEPRGLYSIVKTAQGKRFLIFDPTWEKTPFGHVEGNLQGSDALLVDGAESQAIRIPVLKPEQNVVDRTSHFSVSADGALSGTVHDTLDGDIAADPRLLFSEKDERGRQKYLDRIAARDLQSFQIGNVKVSNLQDLARQMSVDYTVKAEHFTQEAGPLVMLRPRVLGSESFAVDRGSRDSARAMPVDLGDTREVHDLCEIDLPAGYSVDELPRPWNVDLGFASYRSKVTSEGSKLRYERTYTVREVQLPADRYADVVKLSKIIATDEQSTAVLKKTN